MFSNIQTFLQTVGVVEQKKRVCSHSCSKRQRFGKAVGTAIARRRSEEKARTRTWEHSI